MLENTIQKTILSACSFQSQGAKYSELKPKDQSLPNDLFNYHLQYLVKNGFLKKEGLQYHLTEKGKSLVTNIDHDSKKLATNYKVSVYMVPVVKGRVLIYRRLKHPQYGYTGFISGKITFGENILSTAEREFKEETNLRATFKVIGNMRQIRKNKDGDVIEDGIFYICYTDKVSGNLVGKSKEGKYYWIDIDQVTSIEKLFKPSVEIGITEIQKRLTGDVDWECRFIYELEPEPEEY